MNQKSEAIAQLKTPWKQSSHQVWLASTLTLYRNFSKFNFPAKLEKERANQVVSLVYEGLTNCSELAQPQLLRSNELSPFDREFLFEHFLVTEPFHMAHGSEGFITDQGGDFLAILNMHNHLQLHILDTEQEIEKSWNKLIKIEDCVGKRTDFAFNPKFGFLTDNPIRCGTALSITLFLHIPAVIHTGELPELLEKEREEEIEALGLQGTAKELIGDLLLVKNSCTLGLTEEYILTSLRMWATRAVVAEINARKKIKEDDSEGIKNKVTRALGLLTHSYQLDTIEALNALSLVKLGVELGWIKAPEQLNLTEVFFNCRRAHLLNTLEKKVEIPELPKKRAEMLHQIASQLTLAL